MNKIPVILDVDTGIDDAIAIYVAFASEKLKVLGLTTSYGNTSIENTLKNTLNVAYICDKNVKVAMGADKPWKKPIRTSPFIHGDKGLGVFEFSEDNFQNKSDKLAWDFAYELIMSSKEKVTYIALGPCTNVATLIRKYPDVVDRLERVVYMGGELRAFTAGSQVASVNIYHDPEAAKALIEGKVRFDMCTSTMLTDHVTIKYDRIANLFRKCGKISEGVVSMLYHYFNTCFEAGEIPEGSGLALHDPAVVMYTIMPEYFELQSCNCKVDTEGLTTYGYTIIDNRNISNDNSKNINLVKLKKENYEAISEQIFELLNNINE